jgi:hypothetical protein
MKKISRWKKVLSNLEKTKRVMKSKATRRCLRLLERRKKSQ